VGVPTGTGTGAASPTGSEGTTTDPFAITDADKVNAYPSGLKIRGADSEGKCIDASGATSAAIEDFDYFDPVLEFNQDLIYTCEAEKATVLTKASCEGMNFSNHLIFKHLEAELLAFGSFGSADPHKIEDWKHVVTAEPVDGEPVFSTAVGSTEWDDTRDGEVQKVCKVYSNVSYTIYYSEMGY
jgi:hypothetical protein